MTEWSWAPPPPPLPPPPARVPRRRVVTVMWIGLALALVGLVVAAVTVVVRGVKSRLDHDPSAYAKCNGLDDLQRKSTGRIPVDYELLDKRYTCRGFQGATPQRVTEITYVYGLPGAARQSTGALTAHLADELRRAGRVAPGVATIIDQNPTALRLDKVVATAEQARRYADYTMYTPGFVPPGFTRWESAPIDNTYGFDTQNIRHATWTLAGGVGQVQPVVYLSRTSVRLGDSCARSCKELGRTAEGTPITVSDDQGNSVFSRLGDTHVTVDQLTNLYVKPAVGTAAGIAIVNSLRAAH